MACKYLGKIMVLLVELLILIFFKVQANDLAHIPFCPSSPPSFIFIYLNLKIMALLLLLFLSLHFLSCILNCMNLMKLKDKKKGSKIPVRGLGELKTIHQCFEEKIKVCEERYQRDEISKLKKCLGKVNVDCLITFDKRHTVKSAWCVLDCLKGEINMGDCLVQCIKEHF